jgi:hypothetical protein
MMASYAPYTPCVRSASLQAAYEADMKRMQDYFEQKKAIDVERPKTVEECIVLINGERHIADGKPCCIGGWYDDEFPARQRGLYGGGATISEIVTAPYNINVALLGQLPMLPNVYRQLTVAHDHLMWNTGGSKVAECYKQFLIQECGWPKVLSELVLSYIKPTAVVLTLTLKRVFLKPLPSIGVDRQSNPSEHVVVSDELPRATFDEFVTYYTQEENWRLRSMYNAKNVTMCEGATVRNMNLGITKRPGDHTGVIDLDKPWGRQMVEAAHGAPGPSIVSLATGQRILFMLNRPSQHPPQEPSAEAVEERSDEESGLEAADPASCVVPE